MKIILATWEKRNFGFEAVEITLSNSDFAQPDKLMSELAALTKPQVYTLVKMPVGNLGMLHALEDQGFRFLETQFHIEKDLPGYVSPPEIASLNYQLRKAEVSKTEELWRDIADRMTNDMFSTDRVYLDSVFPVGISRVRYANWLMDLLHVSDSHLSMFMLDDKEVFFSVDRIDEDRKVVHGILGGIFQEYQNAGLGMAVWDAGLLYQSRQGMLLSKTAISSNNLPIVRLYTYFGYRITKEMYVLRKFTK